MNKYIKSDLYRYSANVSVRSFVKQYIGNPAFRYMVSHRLVNSSGPEKLLGGGTLEDKR